MAYQWANPEKTMIVLDGNTFIPANPENRDFAVLDLATVADYVAPVPTIADQAATALAAGLAITSTATPALDGIYAIDQTSQFKMLAQVVALMKNGTFTNGTTTILWPDTSGNGHAFDPVSFGNFATACGVYANELTVIINNNAGTLPANSVTIP